MTGYGEVALQRLVAVFPRHAGAARAAAMSKYMRDQFAFYGIPSPARRALQREALSGLPKPTEGELGELSGHLWELPEREYQYAALDILARHAKLLGPGSLGLARTLIVTKSWWDTVDVLASHVVGGIVQRYPECAETMDRWIVSENAWLARTALLHQLRFKEKTDTARLFAYCERQAGQPDFFIRKAIGWALRQYSWTDPGAVAAFVAAHEVALSALSKREALLAINGGRGRRPERPRASGEPGGTAAGQA